MKNTVVSEDKFHRFYVLKGQPGERAIELIHHGRRFLVDDGSLSRSLDAAKFLLRLYNWLAYYQHGKLPPCDRWSTLRPVNPLRRDAELEGLRKANMEWFLRAGTGHSQRP